MVLILLKFYLLFILISPCQDTLLISWQTSISPGSYTDASYRFSTRRRGARIKVVYLNWFKWRFVTILQLSWRWFEDILSQFRYLVRKILCQALKYFWPRLAQLLIREKQERPWQQDDTNGVQISLFRIKVLNLLAIHFKRVIIYKRRCSARS